MKARTRFAVPPPRRHAWPCFGLILGIAVAVSANAADRVRLTDDGYLLIDGKPRLILGMYECPRDNVKLKELASSGFNLVRASANTQALDRVHQAGLYAWIPLGGQLALPPSDPKARERLAKTVQTFKDHPGLLCWEAPDEALWNVWHRRFGWIFNEQPDQIKELLEHAEGNAPKAQIAEWKQTLGEARNRMQRGLWKEGETLYDELWKALGWKPPTPQQRASLAEQQARELGENLTRG